MKKTVWTFGLISGAILAAMMLLTMPLVDRIGYDHAEVLGYTTMVLAFLLVFFGVRSYRDNVAGGAVGFGRALAVGCLIVAVASVCYVATWELIFFQLAPGFAAKFEAAAVQHARAAGGTPAEVQKAVADARHIMQLYRNPAINAAITLLEPLPVGLVMALVSAGILGRRRRRTEATLAGAAA